MTTVENNGVNKRNAILIAIGIHVAILVICFITNLFPPQPPFPEVITMEVAMADLGSAPDGGGQSPSEDIALPNSSPQEHQDVPTPITQQAEQQKELITNDESPTVVSSSTKPVTKPSETATPVNTPVTTAPQRQANQRALFPGSSGGGASDGADDGGQGNGRGATDKGLPDGQPGGKGIGIGNGTWILAGRSLVRAANIETTKEEGTIVMKIWVDRRGNVFRAEPILSLCTSTSEYLISKAKKAALEAQYDTKPDAAPEQVGKMTFKFILK